MRVLLDENVVATLKDHFDPEFEIVTIKERGCRKSTKPFGQSPQVKSSTYLPGASESR
jgi:hypothetical protein